MTSFREQLRRFGEYRDRHPPPRPTPEEIAEGVRADREHLAWLRRFGQESDQAREVAETLRVAGVTARDFRRDAALVLRCDDCAGRVIGHVTYIGHRPLLWTAGHDNPGRVAWLDGVWTSHRAWCRVREYVVDAGDLWSELPALGAKTAEVRTDHAGHAGPV